MMHIIQEPLTLLPTPGRGGKCSPNTVNYNLTPHRSLPTPFDILFYEHIWSVLWPHSSRRWFRQTNRESWSSISNNQLYLAVASLNKHLGLNNFTKHTFTFQIITFKFLSRLCEREGGEEDSNIILNTKHHSLIENI